MNKAQRREALREQLRPIASSWFETDLLAGIALEGLTDAVYPLLRDAYANGRNAADSRAGYRLVQENESLRRELERIKKGLA